MTTKERKSLQSIGFTQAQLEGFDKLKKLEGGSISSLTRDAVNEYLFKKGILTKFSD